MKVPSDPEHVAQPPTKEANSDESFAEDANGEARASDQDEREDQRQHEDPDEHDSTDDADSDSDDDHPARRDDGPTDVRRASFLDDLPEDEELRPLVAAFVAGNYARLREQEAALRARIRDPEILAAASELVKRTEPDPLSKILLGLSVAFFLFIVAWVYLHGH